AQAQRDIEVAPALRRVGLALEPARVGVRVRRSTPPDTAAGGARRGPPPGEEQGDHRDDAGEDGGESDLARQRFGDGGEEVADRTQTVAQPFERALERAGDVGGLEAAPAEYLARLVARPIGVDLRRH